MDVTFLQAPKWVIQRPARLNLFINNHQTPPTYEILATINKKESKLIKNEKNVQRFIDAKYLGLDKHSSTEKENREH